MKRELSDEELAVVDKLIDALAGLSYSEKNKNELTRVVHCAKVIVTNIHNTR